MLYPEVTRVAEALVEVCELTLKIMRSLFYKDFLRSAKSRLVLVFFSHFVSISGSSFIAEESSPEGLMSNPSPTSGISGHHSVVGGRGGGGHGGMMHHRSTESLDSLSDESNHHRNRTPASRQVHTLHKPIIVAWLIASTL